MDLKAIMDDIEKSDNYQLINEIARVNELVSVNDFNELSGLDEIYFIGAHHAVDYPICVGVKIKDATHYFDKKSQERLFTFDGELFFPPRYGTDIKDIERILCMESTLFTEVSESMILEQFMIYKKIMDYDQ